MKKIGLFVIVMVAFLLSGCGGSTQAQEFTSEQGRFSVMSPLPLEESTQSVDSELGPIEVHFFMADQADRAYMVGYSDYPQDFIDQTDPDSILDGARDGAVGNVNGKLVSETNLLLDDQHPGREIIITTMLDQDQEGTVKSHMYLVGNRLYQVMVIAASGEMSVQEMDDFINSFKLLDE
jgi:hypothetical protein